MVRNFGAMIELRTAFVILYSLGILLAFALELRRRAKHLREHPEWRPGDKL